MSDFSIGPITDADIDAVVALWLDCDLTKPWNDPRADIAQARRSGSADILVARDDAGRVLATVMVGDDGHRGWLYYVAVTPKLQGSGLGRRMIAAGEDWMRARGIQKSQLIIRATNTKVRGFYETLGYVEQPRVMMSRWLDGRPMTP